MDDVDDTVLPPNLKPRYLRRAAQLVAIVGLPYLVYWYVQTRPFGYFMPLNDSRCPPRMAYVSEGELDLPPWQRRFTHDLWEALFGPRNYPLGRPMRVVVPAFCVDRTLVTQAALAECIDAGACRPVVDHFAPCISEGQCDAAAVRELCEPRAERGEYPAGCTPLTAAQAFCQWKGKQLPSEAQWRWAAQWHLHWPKKRVVEPRCEGTCKVRATPPDELGLFDMGGNVAEYAYPVACESPEVCAYLDAFVSFFSGSETASKRMESHLLEKAGYPGADVGFRCASAPTR